MPTALAASLVLSVALGGGSAAPADSTPWLPFLGCWQDAEAPKGQAQTCIVPVAGDPLAAEVVALREGGELRRSRLRADGTVGSAVTDECRGSETVRFSQDGRRVFLRGEVTCGTKTTRTVSSFSISQDSRLIHVSAAAAPDTERDRDGSVGFRVLSLVPRSQLVQSIRAELADSETAALVARDAAARRPLETVEIVESVQAVGVPVTEIWLAAWAADASDRFEVTDEARAALEAGDVPPRVIALLEALADPAQYDIALSASGARVTHVGVGSQLEMQRVMYRLAASGAMSSWGATSIGLDGFVGSRTGLCQGLLSQYAGTSTPGVRGISAGMFGVSVSGARSMLLNGCGNFAPISPEARQRVYDPSVPVRAGANPQPATPRTAPPAQSKARPAGRSEPVQAGRTEPGEPGSPRRP